MKTTPDCLSCLIKQAQLTAQKITDDPDKLFSALQQIALSLPDVSKADTPAAASTHIAWATTRLLGNDNPYAKQKRIYNQLALDMYGKLKLYVEESPDPLEAAVRVATMGNAMDLSILAEVDVAEVAEELKTVQWAINHIDHFRDDVMAADQLLYLGDNAGEIGFDRILLETLPVPQIHFAVKSKPIVNDATREDAHQVGIDQVARIVETGTGYLGTPLERCSAAFQDIFSSSQIIIAKGQANFETLSAVDANIYFLLKAKCWPVARELGVQAGDIILMSQRVDFGKATP